MTLPLTRETLVTGYDYLASTPPFNKWGLPDSDDIVFKVVRTPDLRGWYQRSAAGKHTIAISSGCVGRTSSLIRTLAHEMVHLHQGDVKMDSPGAEHNRAFWKLADQVCKVHGFDPKLF